MRFTLFIPFLVNLNWFFFNRKLLDEFALFELLNILDGLLEKNDDLDKKWILKYQRNKKRLNKFARIEKVMSLFDQCSLEATISNEYVQILFTKQLEDVWQIQTNYLSQ